MLLIERNIVGGFRTQFPNGPLMLRVPPSYCCLQGQRRFPCDVLAKWPSEVVVVMGVERNFYASCTLTTTQAKQAALNLISLGNPGRYFRSGNPVIGWQRGLSPCSPPWFTIKGAASWRKRGGEGR